ncbi:unnamed protein product, partial [Linum tenue]
TIGSAPLEDRILRLPGQPEVSFQQYAGYVTVDETQQRKLFYYFVEAETNSTSKPLVLWLNGEANMIYLESPAGVGFSYSQDPSFYNSVNDTITGHYVPQLAQLSVESGSNLCLRTIAKAEDSIDLCIQDEMNKYLNRKYVQQAIHAQLVAVSNWTACTHRVKYDESNLENPTIGVVGSLVGSGIRVLVYSGDQDAAIPFIGTRSLVNRQSKKLGLNTTLPYKPWFDDEKQVGGWTQVYGENNKLAYATIRGASHMAPLSSPKRSLTLFAAFLAGKPLAA